MTAFKPCPFCGSASVGKLHGSDVVCRDCGAYVSRTGSEPRGSEVTKWNRRPDNAALDEAVALLLNWRKLDRPDRYHMGTLNEATDALLARLAPPATKPEGTPR